MGTQKPQIRWNKHEWMILLLMDVCERTRLSISNQAQNTLQIAMIKMKAKTRKSSTEQT